MANVFDSNVFDCGVFDCDKGGTRLQPFGHIRRRDEQDWLDILEVATILEL